MMRGKSIEEKAIFAKNIIDMIEKYPNDYVLGKNIRKAKIDYEKEEEIKETEGEDKRDPIKEYLDYLAENMNIIVGEIENIKKNKKNKKFLNFFGIFLSNNKPVKSNIK